MDSFCKSYGSFEEESASSEGGEIIRLGTQERILEGMAYLALWNLTLTALVNYGLLITFGEADALIPLKTLMLYGFFYWMTNSIVSVYLHLTETLEWNPISLCLKIISVVASVVTTYFSYKSVFSLEAYVSVQNLDVSTLIASLVGMFAIMIGLIFLSIRAIAP